MVPEVLDLAARHFVLRPPLSTNRFWNFFPAYRITMPKCLSIRRIAMFLGTKSFPIPGCVPFFSFQHAPLKHGCSITLVNIARTERPLSSALPRILVFRIRFVFHASPVAFTKSTPWNRRFYSAIQSNIRIAYG